MGAATRKGFTNFRTLSGFIALLIVNPGFLLRSNPGLKLANAFGVKIHTEALPAYGILFAEI